MAHYITPWPEWQAARLLRASRRCGTILHMWLGLFLAALFLAYTNGANDNFKGVATLFGSRTTNYRRALSWATITTFCGSMAALLLAGGLIKAFSGKELVPDALTADPGFLLAVGLGAALTVWLATVLGVPISTTHALTGALVGAGLVCGGRVDMAKLGSKFFFPLAISPLLSCLLTVMLYPALRWGRKVLHVERHMCLCVDQKPPIPVAVAADGRILSKATGMALTVSSVAACEERYLGRVLGFDAQALLDKLHYLSAGMVSFARGLNDTPKIAALTMAGIGVGVSLGSALLAVGIAMALGGILSARKVATTMSDKIVTMNPGQGMTANVVTALLVTVASRFGVPVSTTHVSCGSLFGLGAATGEARWGVIRNIILAWIITLPLGAGLAALVAITFY